VDTIKVDAVAELLLEFKSGVSLLTVVVFVIVEPVGAVTFTTRVIGTVAPLFSTPIEQVTVPVPPGGGATQLPKGVKTEAKV
jgi:hypothetical protein